MLLKLVNFRFILDNHQYVNKKTVLDVGCGSGACSIASAIAGASHVTANDIDPGADKYLYQNYLLFILYTEYF